MFYPILILPSPLIPLLSYSNEVYFLLFFLIIYPNLSASSIFYSVSLSHPSIYLTALSLIFLCDCSVPTVFSRDFPLRTSANFTQHSFPFPLLLSGRGVVRVDVNLQDVDIDQCSNSGWFAGTHRCNLTSMEVSLGNISICNNSKCSHVTSLVCLLILICHKGGKISLHYILYTYTLHSEYYFLKNATKRFPQIQSDVNQVKTVDKYLRERLERGIYHHLDYSQYHAP